MENTFDFLGLPKYKSSQYQQKNQGFYSSNIHPDLRRRLTDFFSTSQSKIRRISREEI